MYLKNMPDSFNEKLVPGGRLPECRRQVNIVNITSGRCSFKAVRLLDTCPNCRLPASDHNQKYMLILFDENF